ncbi:heterocycloanthracin/sonorensin family bacteriocin [Ectobacillus sp. JY-23]|uniref:heterocycloanthracin/sonorensin family bacteriocin n=1 Tax=Ectobacillus sp. JY-23 TaxID=2933872 RepID=UPI001FF67A76|nr:heterocycloanthracin/sonorensin family bacteriocin [Ectobacillus sp. JY-23]UOY94559.1 heterocycloanthracin/sonorensin family bacteriocin [Ectobacillus sp. JY-23]
MEGTKMNQFQNELQSLPISDFQVTQPMMWDVQQQYHADMQRFACGGCFRCGGCGGCFRCGGCGGCGGCFRCFGCFFIF